jgi:hypothetical protein
MAHASPVPANAVSRAFRRTFHRSTYSKGEQIIGAITHHLAPPKVEHHCTHELGSTILQWSKNALIAEITHNFPMQRDRIKDMHIIVALL